MRSKAALNIRQVESSHVIILESDLATFEARGRLQLLTGGDGDFVDLPIYLGSRLANHPLALMHMLAECFTRFTEKSEMSRQSAYERR